MVFKYELVQYVTRAVLLPAVTYHYRCHENSLSNLQRGNEIPKERIYRNVATVDVMKQRWKSVLEKPYFSNWFNFVMKTDYYIISYVLKNRKRVKPSICNSDLQSFLYSPLSLYDTLRYASLQSLLFKILNILPAPISIGFIRILQYII